MKISAVSLYFLRSFDQDLASLSRHQILWKEK